MDTPNGATPSNKVSPEYDVIIIGAGLSGIYSLVRMREQGAKVKVLETGTDVGGTWYWNRYPGARFDSESYSYGYSFSKEVLDEWDWSEHFAGQPEILRYINFVSDKYDVRRDIQFNCTIKAARFHEDTRSWELTDQAGHTYTARFIITAIGVFSNFTLPNIPRLSDFKGTAYHTARWPKEQVSFAGKRVAVIGTGATGIQTIQEVSKTAAHLTVFQRTPNWAIPMFNSKISPEEMQSIRRDYPEIFKRCHESASCFIHKGGVNNTFDVTPEEREAFWEELFTSRGFGFWFSNFRDTQFDKTANSLASEFVAKKIRQRVHDPETARKLIPTCHGFGTRRVPLETNYYEVYNKPNVRLVDLKATPIECLTETGIKTTAEDFELDVIIYATGFNAITGAFEAIDFRGVNGVKLSDKWQSGPKTYLGMTVTDFPNMCMVMGPHQAFGNIPRSIEYAVEWATDLLRYCRNNNITWFEATEEGVKHWTDHVHESAKGLLGNDIDSWMTGVNKNLAGKQERIVARYSGAAPTFRKQCDQVAANNYQTLKLA